MRTDLTQLLWRQVQTYNRDEVVWRLFMKNMTFNMRLGWGEWTRGSWEGGVVKTFRITFARSLSSLELCVVHLVWGRKCVSSWPPSRHPLISSGGEGGATMGKWEDGWHSTLGKDIQSWQHKCKHTRGWTLDTWWHLHASNLCASSPPGCFETTCVCMCSAQRDDVRSV